jgi:DNA-binding XRE family transcriptional regulator
MTINSPGLSKSDINETTKRRFELKCGKPNANGCIPWLAGKTHGGYGYLRTNGRGTTTTAHRIAWVLKRGDIPPEILVLHRCDNPSCVNVDHLFLGSEKQNTADMVSKRRHGWRNGTPWQKLYAGDWERIKELRHMRYTQREVAAYFGVSLSLISQMERGKLTISL